MITEYFWSNNELRKKKCFECKFLQMSDEWGGICTNPYTKVKSRNRTITSRACVQKELLDEKER